VDDDRTTVSGPAPLEEPPQVLTVDRELFSPAGTPDEAFGSRIAISGDVLVVTAPQASVGDKIYAGAADVFVREPASADWAWRKRLTAPDGADFDQFGGSSVAILDGEIFVGASGVTVDSVVRQGAVYVFERDAGGTDNWGQTAKLTDASAGGSAFFGSSIAVQGDLLAVGAPYGPSAGQVTLFERDRGGPGQWGKVTALLDSAVAGGGWAPEAFGSAVALDGDLLLVGASSADVSYFGQEDGAAYLFRRDGADRDQWNYVTRLTAPEATVCTGDRTLAEISLDDPDVLEQVRLCVQQQGQTRNDSFGSQVAIDGDTIVVAATRDSFAVAPGAGVVHVFRSDPATADSWQHVAELAGSDIPGSAGSGFGRALALAGDVLLVGAPGVAGDAGESQGAVYRFERSAGGTDAWGEAAKLVAADGLDEENFGTAVVLDGGNGIVGTAGFDMSRGAVYLTAQLVQQPAFPPTAELADGGMLEGPDGILFGAPRGALTDPLPVWIVEVPTPEQPLPPLTTALGPFCNIGAVSATNAPASLPFAIAFPVPEGADTEHLGMAMLAPAEEGLDSTESGPVWQRLRGFYDNQNNLFCVALPSLVIEGRAVVLIQDPAVTPVTLDEETPAPADLDLAKFDLDCDDIHDPGACQSGIKQRFTNELVTAYNKFMLLGYKKPALLHRVPRVRQFETGPGEFVIVNTFTYYGSWVYAESSGNLAAEYIYYHMLIYFYPAPGNPDADIPRVTSHELFHAFQYGGTEDETKKTIAYQEWDAEPRFVQKSWIVEGTASAAEDSAETMKRSGWVEEKIGLHPVDRSLLASDKAEQGDATKEIIAYQAQDFWVYFGNKHVPELGLGYLQPLFARGVDLQAAVDFFAQDLGTSLGDEYWSWVKNQAIEKLYTLGGALTDPGRIELPRDSPVVGDLVEVNSIDYPDGEIKTKHVTLTILTAAVIQINITRHVDATIVDAGPLDGGRAYRVYVNGECTSEGGPCYARIPEGTRSFDHLEKGDTLYVLLANTNTDPAKRIKYTLTVAPPPSPPPPPGG
jgi:FG-GAP repeat